MIFNCLIVDDEPIAQDIIENYIAEVKFLVLKKKCDNALEALEVLKDEKIDLIFLDIEMPQISGLSFLKTLNNPPLTIITTAFREFAFEGFELDVLDYLLKPISFERFLKAVNKIHKLKKFESEKTDENKIDQSKFIYIKSGYKRVRINVEDILYLEKDGNYMTYHTSIEKELARQTIKEALIEVGNSFMQIHKSYIVHLDKVKSFDNNFVYIENQKIPIGQSYKIPLKAFFKSENKH